MDRSAADTRRPAPPSRAARGQGRRSDTGATRRLRDVLRCNVLWGRYPDGVLPDEAELMLTHGARRATVRAALAMLREEGVVDRVQGIGTFAVRERHVARMGELHGTKDERGHMLELQDRPKVLDRRPVPAPDFIADRLGIATGDTVLCLDYLATTGGEPFAVCTNYLAYPEAEAVADVPFDCDFYTWLRDGGVVLGGTEWMFSAVNADAEVAALLDVPAGTALMLGEEIVWDDAGRIYDIAVCYLRTDRYVFSSSKWTIGGRDGTPSIASTPAPVPPDR